MISPNRQLPPYATPNLDRRRHHMIANTYAQGRRAGNPTQAKAQAGVCARGTMQVTTRKAVAVAAGTARLRSGTAAACSDVMANIERRTMYFDWHG